jgi:transcription elongation factor Elf1
MSETQLNKEFDERDLQRMRNIISGNTANTTRIQTGYTKKHIERSEGDIWEENGKTWTIKNGLKQTVTKHDKLRELVKMPFKCPECERAMKANKLNKKMWVIHKKCFNCVIEYETTLKATGQYEEYAKNIMNANKNTFADDYEAAVKEYETAQPDTYVSEAGDIENWVGGKANPEIIKALKANIKQLRELEL